MITFRSLLVGVVSTSINMSACSGMILAAALMSPVSASATAPNMSPAPSEPSCIMMSVAEDIRSTQTHTSGCQDTESCLQSLAHADRQVLHNFFTATETVPQTIADFSVQLPFSVTTIRHYELARAGPLHEMPRMLAMTLLKRE